MATQTFVKNATTLAAAGWSGAGIQNDDDYIIGSGSTPIVDALDQSGSTTTGINSLNIMRGFTGHLGSPGAPAIIEFKAGVTARHSFVYKAGGGSASLDVGAATTCPSILVDANGTLHLVGSGTITNLYVLNGDVRISGGVTVTNIYVLGGTVTRMNGAGTNPTLAEVTGGSLVAYMAPATLTVEGSGAIVTVEEPGGTITTANIRVGRVNLVASDIGTLNGGAEGVLDMDGAIEEVSVGGSANNRKAGFEAIGVDNPLVTYTDDSLPISSSGSSGGGS